jgi:hypothetical protein
VAARLSRWLGLLLLLRLAAAPADDHGFRVLDASLERTGEYYALNADLDYRFSETALGALDHGVPLALVVRLKVQRRRDYWLDQTVLDESRRLFIRYHPLAKSYQLLLESGGVPKSFASLHALLAVLGEIRGWRVLATERVEPGREYWASLAVKLDIEALPLPLRPVAYVSPSWYLGSPWFRWRIAD